jgi:hypothetical protein
MFYLVGSRFFGTAKKNSDWDYIALDLPKNRELLENLGLKLRKQTPSGAVQYWGQVGDTTVDVCLVTNLEARLYARMRAWEFRNLPKAERHAKIKEFVDAYELG